jgi:post-segregation antitoxin (ccd killing protein)
MRMARINVYLPDELARRVKGAGINVSNVTQEALRRALGESETAEWLDRLADLPATGVGHEEVLDALKEARDEFGSTNE